MSQVNIHDAKTHLSKLIERAAHGEDIVIARAGNPVARLTAIVPVESGRRFGVMKGKAKVGKKFFDPLPEEALKNWE
ncbi:MAG: type II toxin-antitoxin system Phd/YefM family antitoxin [Candidatus Thiodiazotropha sp. (ex Lucinoma kastoroae)]|nr:type II toxin-antitoxin system Phd/YefM family antitoxin [Candidatus Thiodiazotropha sp. (ex Lucinoma kastoroae)]MCU7861383.1 type II toxin-antitoxin system Phd/YefM family antitoxin [Candidatus Thiodiazotropha sp. (ex Lucinoma kastoroae)]